MVSENSSAILQTQMRHIRRELNVHADQMVEKARTQFDWRCFVAKHPWGALGVALAAGYWLVPRRTCCKGVDAQAVKETMDELVRAKQPAAETGSSSFFGWLLAIVGPTLVREGISLVPHLTRQWMERNNDDGEGRPAAELNGARRQPFSATGMK